VSPKYASSPDQPERTPAPGVALSGRFLRPAAQVVVVASPDLDPAWISQALTGIARTTIVTSAAEVSGSAGPDARVSLVIASASLCSRTFLDRLSGDGLSGSVLFLAKDEAIDSIVHALATSHALSVVDASLPPDQFAAHVEGLLFPRAETRHARGGLQIEVLTPEGERARFELRDISNRGLSFETESDALKGWLLPGTWLEHVRVFEGDRLLVDGASAAIRHLVPLEQNPGRNEQAKYRVGAELFAPSRNSARERRVITEAIEMLTLLEGARSDGAVIRLGFPYEPAIQWQARIVSVQRDRTSIVVSGRARDPSYSAMYSSSFLRPKASATTASRPCATFAASLRRRAIPCPKSSCDSHVPFPWSGVESPVALSRTQSNPSSCAWIRPSGRARWPRRPST
jgi:hypothetical protein